MSQLPAEIERRLTRPWRPGQRFRPQTHPWRRWGMLAALVTLLGLIGGYVYLTDRSRLRGLAEQTLGGLLHADVSIGRATLGIFEGLRLDDISISLRPAEAGPGPDGRGVNPSEPTQVFTAETFLVRYELRSMLRGELVPTQIIAKRPRMVFTPEVQDLVRQLARLPRDVESDGFGRDAGLIGRGLGSSRVPRIPSTLPEVLLRDARIEYSERREGLLQRLGVLSIDGRLSPLPGGDRYGFQLQSRGGSNAMGPSIAGEIQLSERRITARLANFDFGGDLRSMLPELVRKWWDAHELTGRVDIEELSYAMGNADGGLGFRVEAAMRGVNLSIRPEELLSRVESRRLAESRVAIQWMTAAYRLGGIRRTPPRFLDVLLIREPIRLADATGRIVFTPGGIDLHDFAATVVGLPIRVDGRVDGYPGLQSEQPQPTARVRVWTDGPITLPPELRFIYAMPRAVREVYQLFNPQGRCQLDLTLVRDKPDGRLAAEGGLDVLDGRFRFMRFAYPVRGATGRIGFVREPEQIVLDLNGYGVEGGPNADRLFSVKGVIGPVNADLGVDVRIAGDRISSEPTLREAFPPDVNRALALFDPTGTGAYPTFAGSFVCDVHRPVGRQTIWRIDTEVHVEAGEGMLKAFPYPLSGISMVLNIDRGRVRISDAKLDRNGGRLRIDGLVLWGQQARDADGIADESRAVGVVTRLKINAQNFPIDEQLLAALPADQSKWLRRLGLSGRLSVDGTLTNRTGVPADDRNRTGAATDDQPKSGMASGDSDGRDTGLDEVASVATTITAVRAAVESSPAAAPPMAGGTDYDLNLQLIDGTLWPASGTFAVSEASARLRLTPSQAEIFESDSRRGDATVSMSGTIRWDSGIPLLNLAASATALPLDTALYDLLPPAARRGWDQIRPQGSVDIDLTYRSPMPSHPAGDAVRGSGEEPYGRSFATANGEDAKEASDPLSGSGGELATPDFTATIRPKQLSVSLVSVPYRLDEIAGEVVVTPKQVRINEVTGKHGESRVWVDGSGDLLPGGRSIWDLELNAERLAVAADLLAAFPPALKRLLVSGEAAGEIDLALEKVLYQAGVADAAQAVGQSTGGGSGVGPSGVGERAVDDRVVGSSAGDRRAVDKGEVDARVAGELAVGQRSVGESAVDARVIGGSDVGQRAVDERVVDGKSSVAASASVDAAAGPGTQPVPTSLDIAGVITMRGASLNAGVPMSEMVGRLRIDASMKDGELRSAVGEMDLDSLMLSGRPARSLKAQFARPPDEPVLHLKDIRGRLAGGAVAGSVDVTFPDGIPDSYRLDIAVQNADAAVVAMLPPERVEGQISAGLALQGTYGNPASRRGRGELVAQGPRLYEVPVILGLLQVTNLTLPLSTPATQAAARFNVQGGIVSFDSISLRSDTMLMQGDGVLDFDRQRVSMNFATDNPSKLKLPFLSDLWKGAQQELLRITVRGSIQAPEVSAAPMSTFQTTIDEVFRSDEKQ